MVIETLTAVSAEPLSLSEARAYVRAGLSDEDALIGALITAAREALEPVCGQILAQRQVRLRLDDWPETARRTGRYCLPLSPVRCLDAAAVYQADGSEQDVTALLRLNSGDRLSPAAGGVWPVPGRPIDGIALTLGVGMAPESVPADLKLALLRWVAVAYTHRDSADRGAEAATAAVQEAVARKRARFRL